MGHNSIGSDRAFGFGDEDRAGPEVMLSLRFFGKFHLLADDVAEFHVRLRRFQAAVKIDRGLNISVT